MNPVFVYGTLKRGFGNHRVLGDSPFLGRATTTEAFHMRCCGFPVVFSQPFTGVVVGELYDVQHDHVMQALDRLEGVPHMYTREQVNVQFDHGRTLKAWIYIGNDENWSRRDTMTHVPLSPIHTYDWQGAARYD